MQKLDAIVLVFSETQKKAEKKEEQKLPKYIVPTSNFGVCDEDEAMILGIPCEVISKKPYKKMEKDFFDKKRERDYIDVVSLLTGFKYCIPNDWYRGYNDYDEAVKNSRIPHLTKNPKSLIGLNYYVKDNSYISDFEGNYTQLIGLPCKVVSIPFKGIVRPCRQDVVCKFILVECNEKIFRTLFAEWCFYK